jgi:flagellar hook assembly protein FlgD
VTTIEYSLPERGHVIIDVYNVLGQKVETLVDREESAGSYTITWDGTSSSGQAVSTGVYLYRFQAGDHIETKKMILLK